MNLFNLQLVALEGEGYFKRFDVNGKSYQLKISPITRLGTKSLIEQSGAVEVELTVKNDNYPAGFEYSDVEFKKSIGGRFLHKDLAETLVKVLKSVNYIKPEQYLNNITWNENGSQQTIHRICK
ncbi:hypothetical protein F0267_02250 [Vibrio coralliilyticus]|uniref:Uncharacterized protein n=3 Tax=Vibrio TaxID=662 RepID=A0AAN0SK99_9VIBR|nr:MULTISPECIES: hypothetical protein [Vibrio]CAH1583073.1 conserved hypothetical protein [Vibrio jasicida]AIW22487.1 hypothetical protein IX92_25820 [Vibrio coralliilyticus]MCZ2799149.1 hypothetical protein [Vibrio alginolyticus]NOH37048.1 hypothetical protein [Vibrio coralliilyticus]PAW00773.1 hypothetical protein CKJ79_25310 [Vibrio coralliilyticus]